MERLGEVPSADARNETLRQWLEDAGLQQYFGQLVDHGVTEQTFATLAIHDFAGLGIRDPTHRQRLFKLIQVVNRELVSGMQPHAKQQQQQQQHQQREHTSTPTISSAPAQDNLTTPSVSASKTTTTTTTAPRTAQGTMPVFQSPSPAASSSTSNTVSLSPKPANASSIAGPVKQSPKLGYPRKAPSHTKPSDVVSSESVLQAGADRAGRKKKSPRIRVIVRKRPMNRKESEQLEQDIVSVIPEQNSVFVHETKTKVDLTKYMENHEFVFDDVFGETVTNAGLYDQTTRHLVSACFKGTRATCFAYGQTGSGKTHTMMGPDQSDAPSKENFGLYALAAHDIFDQIGRECYSHLGVWVSFFEIYGGKLFDLLNSRCRLVAREDRRQNVCIVGLQERECKSVESLLSLIQSGSSARSTGVTGANIDSSRSHAVLRISLCHRQSQKLSGRLSFIDLAGSERGADTLNQDRQTRVEGAEINKSLLALKECIRAQDQHHRHTPFRGSKLTQVLKASFVGNCHTVMIANISPNSGSCEHTLNTLRYADRVKELKKPGARPPCRDAYMPHRMHAPASTTSSETQQNEPPPPPPQLPPQPQLLAVSKPEKVEVAQAEDQQSRHELLKTHRALVSELLEEEESIIESHRLQIDESMQLVREEMQLLKGFDQLGCNVDEYVTALDSVLQRKQVAVFNLRSKLSSTAHA